MKIPEKVSKAHKPMSSGLEDKLPRHWPRLVALGSDIEIIAEESELLLVRMSLRISPFHWQNMSEKFTSFQPRKHWRLMVKTPASIFSLWMATSCLEPRVIPYVKTVDTREQNGEHRVMERRLSVCGGIDTASAGKSKRHNNHHNHHLHNQQREVLVVMHSATVLHSQLMLDV